ncbi:hypothetical protein [Candidatus Nitrospira salsa]
MILSIGTRHYPDQHFIYRTHIGVRQQGRFWGKQHIVRLGIETHAEDTLMHYTSSTNARHVGSADPLSLINIRYVPYFSGEFTPFD